MSWKKPFTDKHKPPLPLPEILLPLTLPAGKLSLSQQLLEKSSNGLMWKVKLLNQ